MALGMLGGQSRISPSSSSSLIPKMLTFLGLWERKEDLSSNSTFLGLINAEGKPDMKTANVHTLDLVSGIPGLLCK